MLLLSFNLAWSNVCCTTPILTSIVTSSCFMRAKFFLTLTSGVHPSWSCLVLPFPLWLLPNHQLFRPIDENAQWLLEIRKSKLLIESPFKNTILQKRDLDPPDHVILYWMHFYKKNARQASLDSNSIPQKCIWQNVCFCNNFLSKRSEAEGRVELQIYFWRGTFLYRGFFHHFCFALKHQAFITWVPKLIFRTGQLMNLHQNWSFSLLSLP